MLGHAQRCRFNFPAAQTESMKDYQKEDERNTRGNNNSEELKAAIKAS